MICPFCGATLNGMIDTRLLSLNRDPRVFACSDIKACNERRDERAREEYRRANDLVAAQ